MKSKHERDEPFRASHVLPILITKVFNTLLLVRFGSAKTARAVQEYQDDGSSRNILEKCSPGEIQQGRIERMPNVLVNARGHEF